MAVSRCLVAFSEEPIADICKRSSQARMSSPASVAQRREGKGIQVGDDKSGYGLTTVIAH
jgi:hypothetical protein